MDTAVSIVMDKGRLIRKGNEADAHRRSVGIIIMVKSRRMRWAWHVARMGQKRNPCRLLVEKSKGKRALGRPRRRLIDNIKMDLGEIGRDGADWNDLGQDRDEWRALVKVIINIRFP
jgi:hypothetical protein